MKTLYVTVIYPICFQIEVDETDNILDIEEQIKNHADYLLETSSNLEPVIFSCPDFKELEE